MENAPKLPYVYQPHGPVSNPERGERLYAIIANHSGFTKIEGLTKKEAAAIVDALCKLND